MRKARRIFEMRYIGLCTVTEKKSYKRANGSTGFQEETVLADQPCRLIYQSVNPANQTDTGADVKQSIKLLIAPEVVIKPGSRIVVRQNDNDVEEVYQCSGEPAMFETHQEILLELWRGWA